MTVLVCKAATDRFKFCLLILIFISIQNSLHGQQKILRNDFNVIDTAAFGESSDHWFHSHDNSYVITPMPLQPRYNITELAKVGDNILLYQKDNGGWPKNYDIMAILTSEQKDKLLKAKNDLNTTFDNSSTYTHVAALAKIYRATAIKKYKEAALKGLNFIITAQYANGGWPQYYPLQDNYSRYITFNDDVMIGIIKLLKDIIDGKEQYSFLDKGQCEKVKEAYKKGLNLIIKTQINDNGKVTGWAQQYNEVTLLPIVARKFEPPAICNRESSSIVIFLMSINNPDKLIINAVQNAVMWFEQSKIFNTLVKKINAPALSTRYKVITSDKVLEHDLKAPPIWSRFNELKTHRPIFANRDGKVVYSLEKVERELRDGYSWYTYAPQKVLKKYPHWKKKWE